MKTLRQTLSKAHLLTFKVDFPRFNPDKWYQIKGSTSKYNCFSWALGITDKWLDNFNYFDGTVESFEDIFGELGYKWKGNRSGERIAIYTSSNGWVMHVAKRIKINGKYVWTSKIGRDVLITHPTPRSLEDGIYGKVVLILSKKVDKH